MLCCITCIYSQKCVGTAQRTACGRHQNNKDGRCDGLQELHELQKRIQLEEHAKLVGKEFEVMVTGENPRRAGELLGRTESYKVVNFPGNQPPGEFVRVSIKHFGPDTRITNMQKTMEKLLDFNQDSYQKSLTLINASRGRK